MRKSPNATKAKRDTSIKLVDKSFLEIRGKKLSRYHLHVDTPFFSEKNTAFALCFKTYFKDTAWCVRKTERVEKNSG